MDNLVASEKVALLGVIPPQALAVAATDSAWIPVKDFESILVIVQTGVLGAAATVDVKLRQATAVGGTGAKDIAGRVITQLVKATDDNVQALVNLRQEQMDVSGGFDFLRVTVTVAAAISLGAVVILGLGPRYGPARLGNVATVKQVL